MNLKKMVMERGMKLMSDPRVMKLMSNPKVMNVVMKGFQLRGKAQASFDQRVQSIAKTLKLATREEVARSEGDHPHPRARAQGSAGRGSEGQRRQGGQAGVVMPAEPAS